MVIIKADVGEFHSRILISFIGFNFHDAFIGSSQISNDNPAFKINCGQQVRIRLLTNKGRGDLLFMIVDNLGLGLLGIAKRDFPEFYSLIGRGRYKHLLATIWPIPHLFAQHIGDVVFVGRELFHCRSLVKAEEIYFVVHASQGIRTLSKSRGSCQSTLRHVKTLFSLQIGRAELLDEAIHRCRDAH